MSISKFIATQVRKHPKVCRAISRVATKLSPETVLVLDFPVRQKQRWNVGNPHGQLADLLNENRTVYQEHLTSFLAYQDEFQSIPEFELPNQTSKPHWSNGWMPALDSVALYGFLVRKNPKLYMEVGSGNSTKFARQAISDHGLQTKIVSIDPFPRAEIDDLCDEVIRQPLEEIDLRVFDRLGADDILYIDNSHRVLMNSDATVFFMDILPQLARGVLIQIHDIFLPYDYPSDWVGRHYSEQYLLAAYLLARGTRLEVILPNLFIGEDPDLHNILSPLWSSAKFKNIQTSGCSFWLQIRQED